MRSHERAPTNPAHLHPALATAAAELAACIYYTEWLSNGTLGGVTHSHRPHSSLSGGRHTAVTTHWHPGCGALQLRRKRKRLNFLLHMWQWLLQPARRCVFTSACLLHAANKRAAAACLGEQKDALRWPPVSTLQVPAPAQRLAKQTRGQRHAQEAALRDRVASLEETRGMEWQRRRKRGGGNTRRKGKNVFTAWGHALQKEGARPVGLSHTPGAAGAPAWMTGGDAYCGCCHCGNWRMLAMGTCGAGERGGGRAEE